MNRQIRRYVDHHPTFSRVKEVLRRMTLRGCERGRERKVRVAVMYSTVDGWRRSGGVHGVLAGGGGFHRALQVGRGDAASNHGPRTLPVSLGSSGAIWSPLGQACILGDSMLADALAL